MNETWDFGDAIVVVPDVMDVANIVTHELGHAAGLGHTPNDCADKPEDHTMYASARLNETKKRDLYQGDIDGIHALYP